MTSPDRCPTQPNVLFIMTDQQRYDTLSALGGKLVQTPHLDALAKSGVAFTNAYSPCPVCVPARYTIMTGCDGHTTGWTSNTSRATNVSSRTGDYLPQAMKDLGYRTWGIGKFHTQPWNEDLGFETQLHSAEAHGSASEYQQDDYVKWLRQAFPAFAHLEQFHGERTDMYYTPQCRAMPCEATVEHWATEQAIEQLKVADDRPFFGFLSYIQPHPPIAPPIPYNRLLDPDDMPASVIASDEIDLADPFLGWMNQLVWADSIGANQARQLKARYYGEIAYLDHCIGRLLTALRERPDWQNTVVVFFTDHGDLLGDHRAWQKESFFENSCRIPLLISWPGKLAGNRQSDELFSLSDLFAIATRAAGRLDPRQGHDVLGHLLGEAPSRKAVYGMHGQPGAADFKAMVRTEEWKYIWIANGNRELLFRLDADRDETKLWNDLQPQKLRELRDMLVAHLSLHGLDQTLTAAGGLKAFDLTPYAPSRIIQFSGGISDFTLSKNPAGAGTVFKPIPPAIL